MYATTRPDLHVRKLMVILPFKRLYFNQFFFAILTPAGRYVLMVSLYDRLGGHVLKWSNLKGQQWGGATLPLQHDGEFFNIEVKVGAEQLECRNPKYCFFAKTPVQVPVYFAISGACQKSELSG